MLSDEYSNYQYGQFETPEEKRKRTAATSTASTAQPYQYQPPTDGAGIRPVGGQVEAQPNYVTTQAPAPTTAVAAPPPVAPGAVTPAGTAGIDGITRSYDYVEGRTNPDPVNTFATESRAGVNSAGNVYDPVTGTYHDPSLDVNPAALADMARRMTYMNEQFPSNPNVTAADTPDSFTRVADPIFANGQQVAGPGMPTGTAQVLPGGVQTTMAGGGAGASLLPLLQQYLPQGAGAGMPGTGVGSAYAASSFGPDNDLRGTQISPSASARLQGMQGDSDAAFRALSSFDRRASYGGYADDLSGRLGSAAQGPAWQALTAPNRSEIARQRLAAFDTEAAPEIQKQLRAVGQRASALGRLGMGQTEVETLEPYTTYLSKRAALSNQLAADTAEGEIGDARYERDAELALNERNASRQYDARQRALEMALGLAGQDEQALYGRFNAATGREQNLYGQEASERNELRGERGFQQQMAQAAEDSAYRQRQQEQSELAAQFARAMGLANLGYSGNPYGTFLAGSQRQGANADQSWDAVAQMLAPYLQQRRTA